VTQGMAAEKAVSRREALPVAKDSAAAKLIRAGDNLLAADQALAAMREYLTAAELGSPEGAARLGHLLLFGKKSFKTGQDVTPNPADGVLWSFRAATNKIASACKDLAFAFETGLGVRTNLEQAYAWLRLSKEFNLAMELNELDRLALRLDPQQVRSAQKLAERYHSGYWPAYPFKRLVNGDPRLKLNGVALGGRIPLAVINNRTFALDESAQVRVPEGELIIVCTEISTNSVTVEIDGENEAHLLLLR
jgi:hypothetical protein